MNDPTNEEQSETETINVVPLADLTLVLLIVLMVLSPMISQSMIHVATPAIKSDKNIEQKPEEDKKPVEPLIISITTQGYALNNSPAESLEQLMAALRIHMENTPDRPVLVTADSVVTVGRVVEVLDLAKMNGAKKVSLLKKPEPDGKDAGQENAPL